MNFTQMQRTVDSRNVVAKITGADPTLKNEYVIYSAHWDHLGIGDPVNGDKIYNGAVDNASGSAMTLEIARAFKKVQPQPKRSILFLWVTAEEQGCSAPAITRASRSIRSPRRSPTSTSTRSTRGAGPRT
jgi:Zn-dependent M28 family amino/carboxypeptidase